MFCTVDTESAFHVCLGPAQEQALEAALVCNGKALLDAFAHIDVRTAKAGPADTALIMGAIEQLPGGVVGLNELAMKQMRSNLDLHCVMNLHRWLRLHLLTDKNHLNLEH